MSTTHSDAAADHAALSASPGPSTGETLRQARESKNLSLRDVWTATSIAMVNLQAIEESDFEHLPADTYTRGFIRIYADFLGLNGPELAERFIQERGPSTNNLHGNNYLERGWLSTRKFAEPIRISPAVNALVLLVIIVALLGLFCLLTGWNPLASYLRQGTTTVALAYHPANPQTSAGSSAKAINLEAHFLKDTEVLLQLDGNTVLRETHAKASTVSWEANSSIHIEFVEPQSAELRVNGQPLGFPPAHNGQYKLSLRASPSAS